MERKERNCSFGDMVLYLLYVSKIKLDGCRKQYNMLTLYKECIDCITKSPEPLSSLFGGIAVPDESTYAAVIIPGLHQVGAIRTTKKGNIKLTELGFKAYSSSLSSEKSGFGHRRIREFHELLSNGDRM